jgi:hypothetical protein
MLFGLKYLIPLEIEDWTKSIIGIKNFAWRFALIVWWLNYNNFLNLAQHWPQDGNLEPLLDIEDSLVEAFWITRMHFESLDAFIPPTNRIVFNKELAKHLTTEVFQAWAVDITSHQTFINDNYIIPIPGPELSMVQSLIRHFEQSFFRQ